MKTEFLFVEQRNVVGLMEALKNESLEDTRIFVEDKLAQELDYTADKACEFQSIRGITWMGKTKPMGFIDFDTRGKMWRRVCRINTGIPFFMDTPNLIPSKIIYIS